MTLDESLVAQNKEAGTITGDRSDFIPICFGIANHFRGSIPNCNKPHWVLFDLGHYERSVMQ